MKNATKTTCSCPLCFGHSADCIACHTAEVEARIVREEDRSTVRTMRARAARVTARAEAA